MWEVAAAGLALGENRCLATSVKVFTVERRTWYSSSLEDPSDSRDARFG